MNRAHRHHRRIARTHLAAHNGLQVKDDPGRQDNRIFGLLGISPVPAETVDGDVNGIHIRAGIA